MEADSSLAPAVAGEDVAFMDRAPDDIVERLLASYKEVGGINHVGCQNLPSKARIARLCEDLLHLLFPGFLDDQLGEPGELEMMTSGRVSDIVQGLCPELRRSIRSAGGDCSVSASLCAHFLGALPEVRQVLYTDVQAAYDGDPAARSFEEIILSYPGIEAIAIQRCAHLLYRDGVELVPRMMTEWAHSRTGIDIHPGAQIGPYFFIDHGTGVVIGETCVIGERVKIYHGVTLGARSFEKDEEGNPIKGIKRHPDVGDGVTIYPNATVLGGETTIGEGSTIGGNVFILEPVAPFSLVAYKDGQNKILNKRERTTS